MTGEATYHSVSVAGVVIDENGRTLVIQRRDNGRWEPPGGILERDESVIEGLLREVREETGLIVEPRALTGVYKNMRLGVVALVFRCRPAGGALSRGRDRPYGRPPAQIPACGITALGSYLGCVAAKRASGKGCITRTGGSHRFRIRTIRVQSTLVFWLRRRSAFSQYRVTWSQKAATAS